MHKSRHRPPARRNAGIQLHYPATKSTLTSELLRIELLTAVDDGRVPLNAEIFFYFLQLCGPRILMKKRYNDLVFQWWNDGEFAVDIKIRKQANKYLEAIGTALRRSRKGQKSTLDDGRLALQYKLLLQELQGIRDEAGRLKRQLNIRSLDKVLEALKGSYSSTTLDVVVKGGLMIPLQKLTAENLECLMRPERGYGAGWEGPSKVAAERLGHLYGCKSSTVLKAVHRARETFGKPQIRVFQVITKSKARKAIESFIKTFGPLQIPTGRGVTSVK